MRKNQLKQACHGYLMVVVVLCTIPQCKPQSVDEYVRVLLEQYESLLQSTGLFEIPPYETPDNDVLPQYNYIVVGCGSSGSVLANRLSENQNIAILVLEAGETPSRVSEVPFAAAPLQFTSKYSWNYLTEKQDNFGLGLIDERMYWPRGKAVGGSSIVNYMYYGRGNRRDYNRWAAMGNPGWSYNDVLPYFLKSEDAHVQLRDYDYHRTGGFLTVEDVPFRSESSRAFVKAALQRGHPYLDHNGRSQMGVSYMQATLRNGRRCSAEKAFVRPARYRPNLTILSKAHVTKVLIDPFSKKAFGVEYIRNNQTFTVNATREVILSAGVLHTPQILMLSGIGPKNHLDEFKIPVVKNLNVGQKLYDHIAYLGLVFTVNQSIVLDYSATFGPDSVNDFITKGVGPLTSTDGTEATLFIKTHNKNHNDPDIGLLFIGGGVQSDGGAMLKYCFPFSDQIYNAIWKNIEQKFAWTVYPMLLRPKSHGYIRLRSRNPLDPPKLYGNYLTDSKQKDMKTLIAGIREAQKLAKTAAFQKYDSQQVNSVIPGCERMVYDSDSYWECAIRHITTTQHDQTSTCKMGPYRDPEAIVDHNLCVHGVQGLRVVDASIIPIPISGHTNAIAYMIGEKAADLIQTTKCGC